MNRSWCRVVVAGAVALTGPMVFAADVNETAATGAEVTYTKQVSRLIQENCQQCHQPNGVAPFSLMNYRQAKGWGKMIKEVVNEGRMPPWHADTTVGHFKNDRALSSEEKATFTKWVDSGMPKGDDADLPAAVEWHNEWRIGEPDMVFEMPEDVRIEPTGVVAYQYFTTPTNFTEDKWVSMAECLPGNPKVVHHIIVFIRDPNETAGFEGENGNGFFDAFAPGTTPMLLEPGVARKIPAGAQIVWQMHYTPTGKLETDRSKFGINFAKGPIHTELITSAAVDNNFVIPANANNHRVESEYVFPKEATIHSFSPHMHYRGKAFDYTLVYPDGREELMLRVPHYDFNWQTTYELAKPLTVPEGTKLHCVAHFDNSAENPFNPDPSKEVRWGDQTWEEMMIGFFNLSFPKQDVAKAETSETTGD